MKNHVKIWMRLGVAGIYGASQTVSTFIRFFAAWLVFRIDSPDLWGEFVKINIVVQLLALVMSWGQRDFLVKEFSNNPASMYQEWVSNVYSRLPILITILSIVIFLPLPDIEKLLIVIWLVGQYFSSSFRVLLLFLKDFKFAFWSELATALLLPLMIVVFINDLSLSTILFGVVIGLVIKSIIYIFHFRKHLKVSYIVFGKYHITKAFPFFTPSLLGVAQTKVDTYFVALLLEEQTLAYYNIFIGLLNFSYNVLNYIINPFIKNVYRIKLVSFEKLQKNFIWLSVLLGCLAMFFSKLLIENYYHFTLPITFYVMGVFNIIAFTIYVFIITKLFRFNEQYKVSLVSMINLIIQVLLAYCLIPEHGLLGAVLINFVGQILTMVGFLYLDFKYSKVWRQNG